MSELKKCPCGKVPVIMVIESEVNKYVFAAGDCCGDWLIEVRVDYAQGQTLHNIVNRAWNETRREV